MDNPSRTLTIRDEICEIEGGEGQEEEEKEVASTTTSYGASNISRDPAENGTDDGRSPLPGDNVNSQSRPLLEASVNGNNNGEPAGGADHVAGRVLTEDHERLGSECRELRGMLPPPSGTAARTRSLPAEQDSSGGASGQGGGPTADKDEEADLLDRARLYILALEREQMLLAEQNGQLECLLEDRMREKHEGRQDKEEDED